VALAHFKKIGFSIGNLEVSCIIKFWLEKLSEFRLNRSECLQKAQKSSS
jgi:hypothetical protein